MLDGVIGNAVKIDPSGVGEEMKPFILPHEKIEKAYKLIRDFFVFTNKRLILVDKQGLTGRKVEYHSVPYTSISHFSIETAGTLDLDSELKIFIRGSGMIQKQFKKNSILDEVQRTLAGYILSK